MNTYGTSLPSISSNELAGVVISSSRLPRSRSRTIATAVNIIMVMRQDHADQRRHDLHGRALLRVVLGAHLEHRPAGCDRCRRAPAAAWPRTRARCSRSSARCRRRAAAPAAGRRSRRRRSKSGGNVDADRHLARAQAAPQLARRSLRIRARCMTPVACMSATSARDIEVCASSTTAGAEAAHVEVDRVAEQQHLHQRNADDHAERQPVAPQLADFLGRDGADAVDAITLTASSRRAQTSSSL